MDLRLGDVLTIITVAGGVAFWAVTKVGDADHTAANVDQLRQDVAEIRSDTKFLPAQQQRVTELERRAQDAQGMFGSLDGRLSIVERKTDVNSAEIAAIKAASGVRVH